MKKELNTVSIRTDLALEAREEIGKGRTGEIDGMEVYEEEFANHRIKLTWVEITGEEASEAMGKPPGNYITIESEAMKENDTKTHEQIAKIMAKYLGKLHKLKKSASILIVGLGNQYVTPDALGPKVVSSVLVTRHLREGLPKELTGAMRGVSAISPGVMGLTGIETMDIIKGVVDRIKPDLVVAIDALAARCTNRINATIQMSDTGISPGAGIGNKRAMLDKKSLGVPVVAIGVPTVVDAVTLVNDTMDMMLKSILVSLEEMNTEAGFFRMLEGLTQDEKRGLISEILSPYAGAMFVTPKEVDAVIERLAGIIANALNMALHPGITADDINRYL